MRTSASWEMPSWYNNDPEPFSSRPVNQLVLRGKPIQISSGVTQILKDLSKSNIPTCLDPFKQCIFEACIQAHFQMLSDDDKDRDIEKLGLTACSRSVQMIEVTDKTLNAPRVVRALVAESCKMWI